MDLKLFSKTSLIKSNILLGSIAVTAPWFIIRVPNTSLSIVDFLLMISVLVIIIHRSIHGPLSIQIIKVGEIPFLGTIFLFLCLLSAFEATFIEKINLSIPRLVIVSAQYAFFMLTFPYIAYYFFKVCHIWKFLRFVALGYIIPMILTIMLANPESPIYFREIFFRLAGRAEATFGNPNAFAAILMIVFPIYCVLSITEKGFWRILGVVGSSLSLVCLVLSASFGGFLIFACLLVVNILLFLFWDKHPARKHPAKSLSILLTILFSCCIILIMVIESPQAKRDVVNRLGMNSKINTSSNTLILGSVNIRINLLSEALTLIKDRFGGIWGHGVGQSKMVSKYGQSVHLLYLLLWIEGGLPLLLVFLAFIFLLMRNTIHLSKLDPAAGLAVGLGIIAITLFGFLNPHIYMRFYWIPVLPCFFPWKSVQENL